MKEGAYCAAKKLFITVTSELASEGASFVAKCEESRLNVVVLQRFETERPVVPSGAVDKNESEFITSDGDTIPESDIHVNDVEVLGDETGVLVDPPLPEEATEEGAGGVGGVGAGAGVVVSIAGRRIIAISAGVRLTNFTPSCLRMGQSLV